MARRSKYEDNSGLIDFCTRMRAGGLSYGEIQARLATTEYSRLGLQSVPSEDTIRRLIERYRDRRPGKPVLLPPDQLDAHHRHLANFGVALRRFMAPPSMLRFGSYRELDESVEEYWAGYAFDIDNVDIEGLDRSVVEEFQTRGEIPTSLPSFPDFLAHLDGSADGQDVLQALEKLREAADDRHREMLKFVEVVAELEYEAGLRFGESTGQAVFRQLLAALDWWNLSRRTELINTVEDQDHRQWLKESVGVVMEKINYRQAVAFDALMAHQQAVTSLRPDIKIFRMMREGQCRQCGTESEAVPELAPVFDPVREEAVPT